MTFQFEKGQRVWIGSDQGTVTGMEYTQDKGNMYEVCMDRSRFMDDKDGVYTPRVVQEKEEWLETCDPPYTLEDIAILSVDKEAAYSPFGYVINSDGAVYALTKQYAHGMVCALLFPEVAKKNGYGPPTRDSSVFDYQRFELDFSRELPVVRISHGHISYDTRNKLPAAQINGVRLALKGFGFGLNDIVVGDYRERTVRKLLKDLEKNDE